MIEIFECGPALAVRYWRETRQMFVTGVRGLNWRDVIRNVPLRGCTPLATNNSYYAMRSSYHCSKLIVDSVRDGPLLYILW